jgi:hypothetical protein
MILISRVLSIILADDRLPLFGVMLWLHYPNRTGFAGFVRVIKKSGSGGAHSQYGSYENFNSLPI